MATRENPILNQAMNIPRYGPGSNRIVASHELPYSLGLAIQIANTQSS